MKKSKTAVVSVLSVVFLVSTASATHVPQNQWAYEDYRSTIGTVYSPLFGTDVNAEVGSSWNEPRGSADSAHGPHTGVDQSVAYGRPVGPMQTPARILRNEDLRSAGGLTQTIRYYNSTYNKLYYSMYMHLSAFVMAENSTPTLSDYTAYSGNSGGVPAHLHFELLDSLSADVGWVTYSSRVGANPLQHVTLGGQSSSTIQKFAVYKNFNVDGRNRTIYFDAWDSNSYVDPLTDVRLYYRTPGGSWTSTACYTVNGSTYRYAVTFPSTGTYEYFIAGRRKSTERWVLYPVSVYDTGELSTGPDLSKGTYGYKTVTF
ncbi:M23 family metallopeptidase [Effusibacillus pohliae]|uniref:hypothetical protein n=1 Tax=Effusibacillus pohliae TaxID=232270 RepID=UPI0003A767DC|nr:hypothetical protein [Effusibacillus pohliae]